MAVASAVPEFLLRLISAMDHATLSKVEMSINHLIYDSIKFDGVIMVLLLLLAVVQDYGDGNKYWR